MKIEINQNIIDLVGQIADIYRQNLEPCKATGNLQNFLTHISLNDNTFLVEFELESYWKYVEYGRGPGKYPPIDKIEEWVKIKPIIPNPINNRIPDTRQLAYLIARKIAKEGTQAQHPLSNTMWSDEVNFLINAIKRDIVDQVYKSITSDEIA